jgi:hypothetical protein
LGALYNKLKRFKEAEPLLHQAYETRSREYPKGHSDIKMSKNNLEECREELKK